MFTNKTLQDKLLIIDELSKAYQRIISVHKEDHIANVTNFRNKLLGKMSEVVDSIEKDE